MSFEKLEAVIKARTPGPWSQNGFYVTEQDQPGLVIADCFSTKNGREAVNGAFIAAMGTLADLMLDVVKAADRLTDNIAEFDTITDACFLDGVNDALDTLRAAQEKLP